MTITTQALDFDWDRFGGTFIDAIGDTLLMVIVTMIVGGFLGLIIGVLLYSTRDQGVLRNKFVYTVLNLLVNFIRPIPFIILIAAIGPLTLKVIGTTVGTNAVMFVMSIAATFGVARIVEQNLVSIDPGVVEALKRLLDDVEQRQARHAAMVP